MDRRIVGIHPTSRHANPGGGVPAGRRPHDRPRPGGHPLHRASRAPGLGPRSPDEAPDSPVYRRTPMLSRVWGLPAGLILLLALCPTPPPADAGGVVGTGTPANCTESALDAALAGGGTVTFNCGPSPVFILVGAAKIPTGLTTVDGGGLITLSGSNSVQLFGVNPGVTLTLVNLTLTLGRGNDGGCIYNKGTLTLINVVVTTCVADHDGGGIFNDGGGQTSIIGSTIRGNTASFDCGGVCDFGVLNVRASTVTGNGAGHAAGGIGTVGNVTLTSTRVTGNTTAGDGGGLYNNTSMTLTDVTLSNNSASRGGGLFHKMGTSTVSNTAITGNVTPSGTCLAGAGGGIFM